MEISQSIQVPVASTETTPSPSHLFQNATGFEIFGGQFVLGDVHNHAGTSAPAVQLGQAQSRGSVASPVGEAYSESEIYCNQLLRRKRGFPLYDPGPQRNLPEEYQRNGIAIGDVGRVTPDGIFDFFFNIYLPADHPINDNDVPEDFAPLQAYVRKDVLHVDFEPGNYVSAPSVQRLDLDMTECVCGSSNCSVVDHRSGFPGREFMFNCEAPRGAVLALPHGAQLQKLENLENIRCYVSQHAESWYRYVNGARGRGLSNGALYLITGCEKAPSWGMATFQNAREEFQLVYAPNAGADTACNVGKI
ncbi:hypothetical protein C8R43DRAFT_552304 [Mycena crocata]|nr:hypothetical protein C8R43DRAFT_552304 [Mycena crocata]